MCLFGLKSALELYAADFTADGLRQLIAELNDTRVFVRCGVRLDVGLNLFFSALLCPACLCEHDGRLDDLPANGVRSAGDGTFEHIRQFHDDGFDLERPDAVTGRLDDIVCSAT